MRAEYTTSRYQKEKLCKPRHFKVYRAFFFFFTAKKVLTRMEEISRGILTSDLEPEDS